MRKQNPNDVVDAFAQELDDSIDIWQRLRADLGEASELAKRVSIDAFQRASVAFENFRSDWHIAAINRDSSQFKADLTQRVEQSVIGRWKGLAGRVQVELPKHPSLEVVRSILDPMARMSHSEARTSGGSAPKRTCAPATGMPYSTCPVRTSCLPTR